MTHLTDHQRGLAMTVFGVLVLTPDTLLLRLVETDHWTIMLWRSLIGGTVLLAVATLMERKNPVRVVRGLGRNGFLCVLLFGGSNISFILSITHTAAANTLVIIAAMPFIAAVLTVILTRRFPPLRIWAAIALAMLGIIIVFWGRFGGGDLFGDVMALFCALFMAAVLVALSADKSVNSLTAVGFGSFVAAGFAAVMGADPGSVSARDVFYLLINGGIVVPVAFGFITYGPKLISAAEVSLIMLLETVLGPLWVWLGIGEEPPATTFVGGSLVILAVVLTAWFGSRSAVTAKTG